MFDETPTAAPAPRGVKHCALCGAKGHNRKGCDLRPVVQDLAKPPPPPCEWGEYVGVSGGYLLYGYVKQTAEAAAVPEP